MTTLPWQWDAMIVVLATSLQTTFDKVAMTPNLKVLSSGYIRLVMYLLLTIPIAWLMGEHIQWYFSPWVVLIGFIGSFSSPAYSVLMKRLNASSITAMSYTVSLMFLAIDLAIGEHFTIVGALAIVGLLVGAALFTMDTRPKIDWIGLLAFVWSALYMGAEAYYAKYAVRVEHVSILSTILNCCAWAFAFLSIMVIGSGQWRNLFTVHSVRFTQWTVVSKTFESVISIFWSFGLVFATVAQMFAMDALVPLVTVIVAGLCQWALKINLEESFKREALIRKGIGVLLLIGCGWLI